MLEATIEIDDPEIGNGPEDTIEIAINVTEAERPAPSPAEPDDSPITVDVDQAPSSDDDPTAENDGDTREVVTDTDPFVGTMSDFDGATMMGFAGERIVVTEARVDWSGTWFDRDTGILTLTSDDGQTSTMTLDGYSDDSGIMVTRMEGGSAVTFEPYMPDLADATAVDADAVNGIQNTDFMTNVDGQTAFDVTVRDMGYAANQNVIGAYTVGGDDVIKDVQILFENTTAGRGSTTTVTDVGQGESVGFFLIQDGAAWVDSLADEAEFEFFDANGDAATTDGGTAILSVDGSIQEDLTIFHSADKGLNADGVEHVLSGVTDTENGMSLGFEDKTGGGDRDYEDVVMTMTQFDTFELA